MVEKLRAVGLCVDEVRSKFNVYYNGTLEDPCDLAI